MSMLDDTLTQIESVSAAHAGLARARLDDKTKPRGSLGRLEDLACQIAAMRRSAEPRRGPGAIVVMGADHGVAAEGVSAYPQEVTGQMLRNFAAGGAAINVLARQAGARVVVVDMGIREPLPGDLGIRSHRIGPGTKNFTGGPAMTRAEATRAVEVGISIAGELAASGVGSIGIGEMGIGNTTASSALIAALMCCAPEEAIGRGTGVDDAGLGRKLDAVRRALAHNATDARDPLGALSKLGGFEIAGLCGVTLGAAAHRVPLVMDGFIAGTAALVATRLAPAVTGYLIASHRSVEPGHRLVLREIGQRPLLDLDLRLGEGTGAVLAMNLVEASLCILGEMATFESAAVSDAGA